MHLKILKDQSFWGRVGGTGGRDVIRTLHGHYTDVRRTLEDVTRTLQDVTRPYHTSFEAKKGSHDYLSNDWDQIVTVFPGTSSQTAAFQEVQTP